MTDVSDVLRILYPSLIMEMFMLLYPVWRRLMLFGFMSVTDLVCREVLPRLSMFGVSADRDMRLLSMQGDVLGCLTNSFHSRAHARVRGYCWI